MKICRALKDWLADHRRIKTRRDVVDKIGIHGEVETYAYYPEYKRQIDRILKAGRGSPKDNWMPEGKGDWQHQMHPNSVVDGKKICAALMAYENLEGLIFAAAANGYRVYNADLPNRYINRPACMQIRDNVGGHYYSRWLRGNDELIGSTCNSGDEYARYVCEIPVTDDDLYDFPNHDAWFNTPGQTLSIGEIKLQGAFRVGWNGVLTPSFLNLARTKMQTDFTNHIGYPIALVAFRPVGVDALVHYGWPDDYTIDDYDSGPPVVGERHNFTIKAPDIPNQRYAIFYATELSSDLTTNSGIGGNTISSISLTNTIPKTNAFALAIVWKILFS